MTLQDSVKKNGYLIALVAVFFWSFNVIIASVLAGEIPPTVISFSRWFVAFIVLLPFTLKELFQQVKLSKREWGFVFLQGLFGIAIFNSMVYKAAETASAIDMALIGTTGPIFMALFSVILLNAHTTFRQIFGLSGAFFGILILLSNGTISTFTQFQFVVGDFWMLLSAITFALYSTLMAFKPVNISNLVFLQLSIMIGLFFLTPFALWEMSFLNVSVFTTQNILAIVYMGIFQSIFAFVGWGIALTRIGTMRAGLIFYTMPLFSTLEAAVFLGEKLTLNQLLGGAFVLLGVVYAAFENTASVKAVPKP